jgi:trypsin
MTPPGGARGAVAPVLTSLLAIVLMAAFVAGEQTAPAGRRDLGHPGGAVAVLVRHHALSDDPYQGHFCAAVLVQQQSVLTAAHCVQGRDPHDFDVIVGADNLCRGRPIDGSRVRVRAVSLHPGYARGTGSFDLAELSLGGDSASAVARIANSLAVGSAVAYGWGAGAPGSPSACRLQVVGLMVPDQQACPPLVGTGGHSFDPRTMLCALPNGDGNTCYGDSGGPLMAVRDGAPEELLGIVSWGRSCDDVGVYARASLWPF